MPFLVMLMVPFVLWRITSDNWHIFLAILYTVVAGIILFLYVRGFRRQSMIDRANPITWASAKWLHDVTPATFAHQLSMSVQLQGWRVMSSAADDRDRVELIAKKDRWTVALLCIGPDQAAATAADEERLAAMRQESHASHSALVTTKNAPTTGLFTQTTLRFDDLARLEDAMGLRT